MLKWGINHIAVEPLDRLLCNHWKWLDIIQEKKYLHV